MKICSLSYLIAIGGYKYHGIAAAASSSSVTAEGDVVSSVTSRQAPKQRKLASLNKVGNNGAPAELFPLGLCEGDCDNDAECGPGLGCFQRGPDVVVRGCDGNDSSGTDYCYDPTGYLHNWGNNGVPAELFPLIECQGDCDNDGECAEGLYCFQRSGYTPVPGCEGEGKSGSDYCFARPANYVWRTGNGGKNNMGVVDGTFPLGPCESDCDRDSDCAEGLKCFMRDALEPVPNCVGVGYRSGDDVCYSPAETPDGYKEPYQGICEHSNEMYNSIIMDGLYTDPMTAPSECATYCNALGQGVDGYTGFTTKIADGQCQCHFDDGSMPFPIPEGATEISSYLTVGEVTDGTRMSGYECFAYLSYSAAPTPPPTPAPSTSPTPSPTRSPAVPSLVLPRPIQNVGNNGVPEHEFPLESCFGDCDKDSDCKPGLYCFTRDPDEFPEIPGCTGSTEEANGYDVCFERPDNYVFKTGNNGNDNRGNPYLLGACEGDCDNDSECEEGLVCFQRTGFEPVPYCEGVGRKAGDDICINPTPEPTTSPTKSATPTKSPSQSPTRAPAVPSLVLPRPIQKVGDNGVPELEFPLESCFGDCDKDSDCKPGLYCFTRDPNEPDVPGCTGSAEEAGGYDVCFERPANYVFKAGNEGIDNRGNPYLLGACEGDCDNNSECAEGLVCFQRTGFEPVPYCEGVGREAGVDICIYPTPEPTTSPSKSPSLSPSVSPTTSAPTDAPTLNEVANILDEESYVSVFGCNNIDVNIPSRIYDGSTDKFVCDRTGLQGTASGMVIIPSHNKVSIAKALRVYSHNDCSGCDPVQYTLEGRSSANGSWASISSGSLPWTDPVPGRNFQGEDLTSSYDSGDGKKVFTEVSLGNNLEYLHYKLTFEATRDSNSNSLQFAEIELPGVQYEELDFESSSTESFVQALSCPSVGSSKVIGAGTKIVKNSDALIFCGIFIHNSDVLTPYSRSYDTFDWEAAPGPLAASPDSISCTGSSCLMTLPVLADSSSSYVILSKDDISSSDGTRRFLSTSGVRKSIAKFLEMVTFGTKMSEIDELDNGNWDEAARAAYVQDQINMPKSSHREYFRKRANRKWITTAQEARSDHPCSPNSKWRRYSFLPEDRYDPHLGDDLPNIVTFETVSTEQDTSQIFETDAEGDVVAHSGVFENHQSGVSGLGHFDFGSNYGFLELNVELAEASSKQLSFRYANGSSKYGANRPCQLFVNQQLIEASYDFKYTDSDNYWMYSKLINVDLVAGSNNITLVSIEASGPDIDHLRLGKPAAVLIKQNGHYRAVAKNGIHALRQFDYEFAEDTDYNWSTYPYPPLGDLYRYPFGRASVKEAPSGDAVHPDVGNLEVDWTGYEQYIGDYFEFSESDVFIDTSSDLIAPYVNVRGNELLLTSGFTGPICENVPQFAEKTDAPIFGKLSDGSWVQWTPTIIQELNGPSINDEDMTANVLSDGGAEWMNKTGGVTKCSNVPRSFVNEDTCFMSSEACLSNGGGIVHDAIVCGSLGEVANDPTLTETYAIESELDEWYNDVVQENQKTNIWTEIALNENDQLRQRMAWALSQIVTTVPDNINADELTEVHTNFYDIMVRNAFGNYRDILREASYNALMAEHLTYEGSKSTSFVYEDDDKRNSNADENYAREIMQLFSIGLIKLNDDGTPVLNAEGNAVETYSNEDIVSFARGWTGFSRTPARGNIEIRWTSSTSNRLDPMKIVPKWRDPFPKTDLQGGYIGDKELLCTDLPPKAYLKKGATYRLLGSSSIPELMEDEDELADDAAYNISRVELVSPSALYDRLYNGGNYELTVVLENDLACTPDTVECLVDTLRVIKVGSVYYEYVQIPCVQLGYYDNGKQVQLRVNTYRGTMCANPELAVAREACCKEDHYQDIRIAEKVSGVTHFYDQERMTYDTAKDRCVDYGKDLCFYETVDQLPDRDSFREHGYHWTNKDCGINVKVNADGYVAIVHDVVDTYVDTIPWLVAQDDTLNWFKVHWSGDYPGSSETNTCAANGCKQLSSGHCLCKTFVTETAVFSDTNVSVDDVMSQLFLATYAPQEGSVPNDLGGVTAHSVGDSVDKTTVFEVSYRGKTVFLKNVVSNVELEGWTMTPTIYEAEQAEVFNAEIRSSGTVSATGGELVWLYSGANSSSYIEFNDVVVPVDGEYEISLRAAVDYSPRPLSVFVNDQEVKRQLSNPNTPLPLNSITSASPLPSSLARCDGDCDADIDCMPGLFCMQNTGYESVPGCSVDESASCPSCQKKGWDYCADINDFDYGFTVLPTGGSDDDWHMTKPLKTNLIAGQNNIIRLQIPDWYSRGPNIDHMVVTGASSVVPSSFRNPPHYVSLMPDGANSATHGEMTVKDAQYETEAILDEYFYHPNTAPFLCPRVMQRFGFSNPSGRYIASCVEAYRTGSYTSGGISFGTGKYGDLAAMAASIVLDREATDPAIVLDPAHGNMREPILKLTNLMRSMDYRTHIPETLDGPLMQTSYGIKLPSIAAKIGNGPYMFPSVFSYYLPGYIPTSGSMVKTQLVSPEASVVTTPNIAGIINGLLSLIKYGLGSCKEGLSTDPGYGSCVEDGQYTESYGHLFYEPAADSSLAEQAEELSLLLTAGRLTKDNIDKIVSACSAQSDAGSQFRCMQQLVVTSGEFHSTSEVTHAVADEASQPAPARKLQESSAPEYKAIVYYNLAGGVDSYNMLAPYSCSPIDVYDNYRKVRGQSELAEGIGMPLDRLLEIPANNTAQPCSSFGIHEMLPALRDLYLDEEALFIANAGFLSAPATADNYRDVLDKTRLFSHDGMTLEMKLLDVHDKYVGTGVGGRMLDTLYQAGINANAFSVDGEQELLVGTPGQGDSPFIVNSEGVVEINDDPSIENMNEVIKDINGASTIDSGVFAETWSSKLIDTFAKTELLKAELDKVSLQTTWTADHSDAREFKTVTQIMQTAAARGVSRDLFFVRTSGWDTHSDVDARLIEKFTRVNDCIRDFVAEVKALGLWEKVTLVQFTEFGRTLDQNSNNGADHAWGGHHFMLGGKVKGGRVLGKYLSEFEPGPENPLMLTSRGRVVPEYPWDSMWYGTAEWFGVPEGPDMEKVLPMHTNFPSHLLYDKEELFHVLGENNDETSTA